MNYIMNRREFGAGLLGSLVALHIPKTGRPVAATGDKMKPSVFGGIEVGVQSYTFRAFKLDQMIEQMQSIGLSSVELWDGHLNPGKTSEDEFKAVKKKFDDAGIKVSAYCVNFPENSTDD